MQAIVSGWGATYSDELNFSDDYSDILMEVKVNTMTNAQCRATGYKESDVTDNMICAGSAGKDACKRDSGGPLITADIMTGNYKLIGVVSWGNGCGMVSD